MTQTQLLLAIFIPTLTILLGILLNSRGQQQLEAQIAKLDVRISAAENRLDARMTALESRFHADMLMVIGKLTELEVRVARLEGQRQ